VGGNSQRLKPFPDPPTLFPLAGEPTTALDLIPIVPDPTGRGAHAWEIMSRLPITEGEHAGKLIGENAPPWQPRLTKLIFGHVDAQRRRMLRECFVNMGKKGGKTAFAAALALTKLLLNEEQREQIVCLAATKEQARIAYDSMTAMIHADPALAKRFEIVDYRNVIKYSATNSRCTAIADEMASLVGFNPSFAVVDELWLLGATPKGQRLVSQIRTGSVARKEPLLISISTAPTDMSEGIFESTLQKARRVIAGTEVDPGFFGWICEPPAGLDPEDPTTWHWANPSIGYTISLERLKANYASVQQDPAALRDFRSQNLNIHPDASAGIDKWLSLAEWDAAGDDTLTCEALIAESVILWLGVDAGSLDDLSALILLGRTDDGRYQAWGHQWVSRKGYEKRKTINPYDDWINAGELTLFEDGGGDVVDMAKFVNWAPVREKLRMIALDSYGATELGQAFADSGVEVQAVPQGWKLTPCLSWVERRLADGQLRHDAKSIMQWNVSNAVITRNGNAVSISKETAVGARKIDGVAALLNAVAACLAAPESNVPAVHVIGGAKEHVRNN
jgi:phage terminase large subunit-like protein